MSDDKEVNVSDEAVEAGAKALAEDEGFDLDAHQMGDAYRAVARSVLVAAAPHLMARAWDESADEAAVRWWMHEVGVEDIKARNPYRNAGAGE